MDESITLIFEQPFKANDLAAILPLSAKNSPLAPKKTILRQGSNFAAPLPVGTNFSLREPNKKAILQVIGNFTLPCESTHAVEGYFVKMVTDFQVSTTQFSLEKDGYSLAWLTLSDRGACGLREDLSGPTIQKVIGETIKITYAQGLIIPDDPLELKAKLTTLALRDQYDLIITTGGTGLTSRDITPETTAQVLDYTLPGFMQAMMAASLNKTPTAILSRALAGVLHRSLILNLPGSVKAVTENLAAVLPALPHALAKLHDDPRPCGG